MVLRVSLIAAFSVAAFFFGLMAINDPAVMFGVQTGPGAFYRIMSHDAMASIFGARVSSMPSSP